MPAEHAVAADALLELTAELTQLSADLRLWRNATDNLRTQLDVAKEIVKSRDDEIIRLKDHHRDFVLSLVRARCSSPAGPVLLEDLIYDAYESDVVVALERSSAVSSPDTQSLMYKDFRLYRNPHGR